MELDYEGASSWGYHSANCTPVLDAGRAVGAAHPDADLQRQGQRRRLPRPAHELPTRHVVEPLQPAGLDRQRVVLPDPVLHRLHQVALALAAGARIRGGGAGAVRAHRERLPGRRHRPVRAPVGDHQLRPLLRRRRSEDDPRRARLRGRDVEPRGRHGRHGDVGADRAVPVPQPARQAEHGRPGPPPRWLGLRVPAARLEDALLRDAEHRPRARVHPGRPVGRLSRCAPATATTCAAPTCWPRPSAASPSRCTSPIPRDSALAREIAGEHLFDIETTTLPEVYTEGDLYLCMFRGGGGRR